MNPATTDPTAPAAPAETVPPLRDGDRLSRDEFERRYDAMPDLKKAELIEGIVYMPSPVSDDHSAPHFDIITWLGLYKLHTPGLSGGDNGSLRLDLANMPQPDTFLRILETHGGQSHLDADRYVAGAPELVAEVAVSSAAFDLNVKMPLYRRSGVKEAIVWRVLNREIDWFILCGEQYERLPLTPPGLYRSEVFPGLWLDPRALVRGDMPAVANVVQQGVNTPEHAAFVQRLQQEAARRRP